MPIHRQLSQMLGATRVTEQLDIPAATVCRHAPPGTWAKHVQFQAAVHCSKSPKSGHGHGGEIGTPLKEEHLPVSRCLQEDAL
jgi:hypothetical protein